MKISKLFHWLYACLMLLPIAFIGVRCGYVMFNKNAKDSYSGTEVTYQPVYYETNEVQSFNDLVVGNVYQFNFNYLIGTTTNTFICDYRNITILNYDILNAPNDDYPYFFVRMSGTAGNLVLFRNRTTSTTNMEYYTTIGNLTYFINEQPKIYFIYLGYNNDLENMIPYISSVPSEDLPTDAFEEVQVSLLDNAFEYSVNQLNEVPLFSWAQSSFLVTPFSYITGLFGIATESPINTLLSYWLTISICWLVFDLVMYVPLLVHRWLDKGVLE